MAATLRHESEFSFLYRQPYLLDDFDEFSCSFISSNLVSSM